MKKFTISIEEVISQNFEIEANNLEDAMKKAQDLYNDGVLTLELGQLNTKQMCGIDNETSEVTQWVEF